MSTTIKFIITVILVVGFSYASYYICERKFNYANFDDNLSNLQAILKVEKSIA
jgi:peptidoglycan/LPS O-acetylase OafA/YrhL